MGRIKAGDIIYDSKKLNYISSYDYILFSTRNLNRKIALNIRYKERGEVDLGLNNLCYY
jgi:hypothetical protein